MGRLIVLTTPDLELGYRLAGVATRAVASSADAGRALQELLDAGTDDVIAVHEPFFHELERPLRRRIETLTSPLVVAMPAGRDADVEAERRARLLRMLWQAVGYEMTFDRGENGQ
ncbi:MAG TPA: V-type ATP synthase subunit F [Gaiellaceae bacterium]|nr:V-type ATP synthase subunit F [Gaiellaceae bacterium]